MKISEVIERMNELMNIHGDIPVKIVNYHSDFKDEDIEDIEKAISYTEPDEYLERDEYIIIGGESW